MYKKNLLLTALIMMFSIMVMSFTSVANDSGIDRYQKIIDNINSEYNTSFEIADEESFAENIINKMSPSEYEEMLKNDAIEFSQNETEVIIEDVEDTEYNDIRFRTGISYGVVRRCTISKGTKLGQVWASFDIVDLSTLKQFSKFRSAGYTAEPTIWYFKTSSPNIIMTFNSSECKIKYSGYWYHGPSGLREAMDQSYTITYIP